MSRSEAHTRAHGITSSTRTADEAKAENIRVMGQELGSVYDLLGQQIAWLHHKRSEYVVLFGTKESRVIFLNKCAASLARVYDSGEYKPRDL